ncbi:hypothetical protein KUTeg_001270 [Tegillarca granosa]|uniref:Uncharacterized protein n=1 Tax=Tegillarca granosa TaxID=220873 RepID=A0ABQ9FY14_TEGGR|nr:hypothetical protein KUTeg_001270 [Tegillarca granosa]
MGIGFSKSNFLKFVGIFGKHKGIRFKNGQPSEMLWRKFKVRNPGFSLRAAEATASVRHDAMSRPRIARVQSCLAKERYNIKRAEWVFCNRNSSCFNQNAIPEDAYKPNEAVSDELTVSNINNEVQSAKPDEDTSLKTVENQTIASITLSLPITEECQVYDLPLVLEAISDDGLDSFGSFKEVVTNSEETFVKRPDISECSVFQNECTPTQALEVVESTLSSETLTLYHAGLLSNVAIPNDPMFATWKMYKDKSNYVTGTSPQEPLRKLSANSLANKIYPLPKPKPTATRKRKQMQHYFVLTSDEIFNKKKKAQEEKVKKAEEKEQKRQIREQKKLMKMLEKLKKKTHEMLPNKINNNNKILIMKQPQ